MNVARFFRTPKGLLILVMGMLTGIATIGEGVALVAPVLVAAVLAAMLVDAPILRVRDREWIFPDGALLTGLFVALILSPHEPWHVAAVTSIIAVVSKYVFRARRANVFNPAAIALVASYYLFDTGQSWWGSLPDVTPSAIFILLALGAYITRRINKVAAVLTFLGVYYLLFTVSAFAGDPSRVAALYRAPDLHATLFFAFFMVTDPPTSPPKQRDQVVFGLVVAVVSYAVFELNGAVYFLLAGLLAGNLWEAGRRLRRSRLVARSS